MPKIFAKDLLFLFFGITTAGAAALGFQSSRIGNENDAKVPGNFGACLAGGGSDAKWSDGWKYLLTKANGGDVLIVRTDGHLGGYQNWIYKDQDQLGFPKVNSVTTIVIDNKSDADSPAALKAFSRASLIFFAGGDQANYMDRLKDSDSIQILNNRLKRQDIAIGGTSAGMAILGGVVYAAHFDSPQSEGLMVTADDVLKNPMGDFVDIQKSILELPNLDQVVTDTHFSERNRQGRILGFMARSTQNQNLKVQPNTIKGIAIDEGTAVCMDESGKARVFGAGNAFFLKGNGPIERIGETNPPCLARSLTNPSDLNTQILQALGAHLAGHQTLEWNNNGTAVTAYIIPGRKDGNSFDLLSWSGSGGQSQFWFVDGSTPQSPQFRTRPAATPENKPDQ